MFDTAFGVRGAPPSPRPPRSASINTTRAMLPLLRAQGSAATVEALAMMLAVNAIEAARWAVITWPGEDLTDATHSARVAALDSETPPGQAGQTMALLADACARHLALTGCDGLDLARAILIDRFGDTFAVQVLAPLEAARQDISIDALIYSPDSADPPPAPPPQPTPAEREAAFGAMLSVGLADPRLCALADALRVFRAAHKVDPLSEPSARAALATVEAALQGAADQGVELDDLRLVLAVWHQAGGPEVTLTASGPPAS